MRPKSTQRLSLFSVISLLLILAPIGLQAVDLSRVTHGFYSYKTLNLTIHVPRSCFGVTDEDIALLDSGAPGGRLLMYLAKSQGCFDVIGWQDPPISPDHWGRWAAFDYRQNLESLRPELIWLSTPKMDPGKMRLTAKLEYLDEQTQQPRYRYEVIHLYKHGIVGVTRFANKQSRRSDEEVWNELSSYIIVKPALHLPADTLADVTPWEESPYTIWRYLFEISTSIVAYYLMFRLLRWLFRRVRALLRLVLTGLLRVYRRFNTRSAVGDP